MGKAVRHNNEKSCIYYSKSPLVELERSGEGGLLTFRVRLESLLFFSGEIRSPCVIGGVFFAILRLSNGSTFGSLTVPPANIKIHLLLFFKFCST